MVFLWKTVWWFLKKLNRIAVWSSNSTSKYILKILKTDSNRSFYTDVHCGIIHKSQKVETTQVSYNRWMVNKMWSAQTMEYYSPIKRNDVLTPATTLTKPWKHYAMWNKKPDTKKQLLYDSTYMKCLEKANSWKQIIG